MFERTGNWKATTRKRRCRKVSGRREIESSGKRNAEKMFVRTGWKQTGMFETDLPALRSR
jgi:hypothetical protein